MTELFKPHDLIMDKDVFEAWKASQERTVQGPRRKWGGGILSERIPNPPCPCRIIEVVEVTCYAGKQVNYKCMILGDMHCGTNADTVVIQHPFAIAYPLEEINEIMKPEPEENK